MCNKSLTQLKVQPRNSNFLVGGTAGIQHRGQRIDRLRSHQRAANSQQSTSGIFGHTRQAASKDGISGFYQLVNEKVIKLSKEQLMQVDQLVQTRMGVHQIRVADPGWSSGGGVESLKWIQT